MTRKLFDTDGIRGTVNKYPMTPEMMLKIGKAIAYEMIHKNGSKKHRIVIGKDTRISGYMFETALTAGIVSTGVDVLLVGPMPTPAIAHLTKSLDCDVGIVLTASHNPAEDNGIKVFDKDGFKLPDEVEESIEKHIFSEKELEKLDNKHIGKAYRIEDAKGRYIEVAKSSIDNLNLEKLKIVLDCANGAAYETAPTIFSELGAEVITLNNKPDGYNINKNCGSQHPEIVAEIVKKEKADIGITFDGDADRVIICDENGKVINGDYMLTFCALDMKKNNKLNKNTLVVTEYSNLGVDEALEKAGISTVRVKNGDRYVIEEMKKNNYNLGGEFSGHMIFLDYTTTGDGIIFALQILKLLKQNNLKASEIRKVMQEYPQTARNIEVKEKPPLEQIPSLNKKIQEIEERLKNIGRLVLRYSGTQNICRIMIEGKDKEEIERMANELAKEIQNEIGI